MGGVPNRVVTFRWTSTPHSLTLTHTPLPRSGLLHIISLYSVLDELLLSMFHILCDLVPLPPLLPKQIVHSPNPIQIASYFFYQTCISSSTNHQLGSFHDSPIILNPTQSPCQIHPTQLVHIDISWQDIR